MRVRVPPPALGVIKRNPFIFRLLVVSVVCVGILALFLKDQVKYFNDDMVQSLGEAEARSKLEKGLWCNKATHPFGLGTVIQFFPNETYVIQKHSDYTEKPIVGNWRYDKVSDKVGYVTLTDISTETLYAYFDTNNSLWMGGLKYLPCDGKITGEIPQVLQKKPEMAQLFTNLSGKSFTRVSQDDYMNQMSGNDIAIPKHLTFGKDGKIEVRYATNFGNCKVNGYWSAWDHGTVNLHNTISTGCWAYKVVYVNSLSPEISGPRLKLRTLDAEYLED